jgi:hypothetical protein
MELEKVISTIKRKAAAASSGEFKSEDFTLRIFAEQLDDKGRIVAPSEIWASASDGTLYKIPLNQVFAQGRR